MSTQITFLGQSTVSIKKGNHFILTDPVFSQRILFLKRQVPLPVQPSDLPTPTAIFISHSHYDHLDIPTFKFFPATVPIILPQGVGRLLRKFVKNPLIELHPNEEKQIQPGLHVKTFPVSHVGFRLSGLTYRQCVGYEIDLEGTKIFFPGDTAYRADFKLLGPAPDIALLPIGPCKPEWLVHRFHLNVEEALDVLEDLSAKIMIPVHWGTFRFLREPLSEPIEKLKMCALERGLEDRVKILRHGESLSFRDPNDPN